MTDSSALKERIIGFVQGASTEIAPAEKKYLPRLVELLPHGSAVYISNPPSVKLSEVTEAALAVQRAGFTATPHIVARRLNYPHTLRIVLAQLCAGGVEQIMLVAGDDARAIGQYEDTLKVLNTGYIEMTRIKRLAVAGYPEGHRAIGKAALWTALEAKQAFAKRTGLEVRVVTQFSLDGETLPRWEDELVRQRVHLPICVGISGPMPPSKLIQFATHCGIDASQRSGACNSSQSVGDIAKLANSPGRHVMRLMQLSPASRVVAPHFFSFGTAIETAKWINRVTSGDFIIDYETGNLEIED